LLVFGWGPFMAFHLQNIPQLSSLYVHAARGSFLEEHLAVQGISLLGLLQLGAIGVAAVLAGVALSRIRFHSKQHDIKIVPWGWRALSALCTVYCLAAAVIVFTGRGFLR